MANPERGEVDLVVTRDGVATTYTLKLSMNAAVQVESRTKRKIGDLVKGAQDMEFTAIRELMFVLLQKHHGKEFPTLEKVGDLIDDAGLETFQHAFADLSAANQPDGETEKGSGTGNPPTAPGGTGGASTLTRVA